MWLGYRAGCAAIRSFVKLPKSYIREAELPEAASRSKMWSVSVTAWQEHSVLQRSGVTVARLHKVKYNARENIYSGKIRKSGRERVKKETRRNRTIRKLRYKQSVTSKQDIKIRRYEGKIHVGECLVLFM